MNNVTQEPEEKKIKFQFITEPFTRMLHEVKDLLIAKNQQLNFLKQEITSLTIEEKLQNPKLG